MRSAPRKTRHPRLVANTLFVALGLSACSGGNDASTPDTATASASPGAENAFAGDDRSADDVLHDAAQTSLEATSFTIKDHTALVIGPQDFGLDVAGSVDYDAVVVGVQIAVEASGSSSDLELRSDGTTLYVRAEGPAVPAFPEGATWLAGDASRLRSASTFTQAGLLGVLLTLSGSRDARLADTGEMDGVAAREFTVTIPYEEAVAGAGAQTDELTSAFKLTGDATASDLVIDVWVGEDDVVRDFDLKVDSKVDVTGGVQLTLSDVGKPVEAPEPPDADETLHGPEADAALDRLVT